NIIYPLDYGYLENTTGGDGDGIDIWLGSLTNHIFDAIVCSADQYKRDAEIKILLGCTAKEKEIIIHFLTHYEVGAILIERPK
ncbi:MAG: inorganic pyrophosphatase, partial [Candidatus Latescibacterota bacterium]